MSEIINAIKVIKMYAWEKLFEEKIAKIRFDEIKKIKRSLRIKFIIYTFADAMTKFMLFIAIISMLLFGFELNSEIAFVTLSLLNAIRLPITLYFPLAIGSIAENKVTLNRA
ncbi:multidrug resistance-associated protein 4-like protein, partial [Leptotrombidium deliense]